MTTEKNRLPEQTKAIVSWKGEKITIGFHDVKTLICPLATDQETVIFLKTCQSLQLNPFAGECYLIKYAEEDKAAFVIAIDSYLKSAEVNKQYDGCEAGIILKNQAGALEFREGSFILVEEKAMLVGGWARVYRKDRGRPTYTAVNKVECIKLNRFGKPTRFWSEEKQPWMLRKTALKRGLVEAFPSLFAGTLATAELGGDIADAEYREIPEGTLPPGLEKNGKPDWHKFWPKVKDELGLTEEQAHSLLQVKSIKEELIDRGLTMEQIWDALVYALRARSAGADRETGEIPTEELESELFDEKEPSTEPEEGDMGKPKRDPESIKSINDLLRACHDDFGLQPPQVYAELHVGSASQISQTPAQCYSEIAVVRKED